MRSVPKSDDEDANTFREGNDFNRPCVLPDQVQQHLDADDKEKPGFVAPVPKKLGGARDDKNEASHRQLPKYLGVATSDHYHPMVGFCDRSLTEWGAN